MAGESCVSGVCAVGAIEPFAAKAGGNGGDIAYGVAVDASKNIIMVGAISCKYGDVWCVVADFAGGMGWFLWRRPTQREWIIAGAARRHSGRGRSSQQGCGR